MSKPKKTTRTPKLTKKAKPRKGSLLAEQIADQAIAATEGHLAPDATQEVASTPAGKREELCVFAFRLTAEERDTIHHAAGPGRAAKFARTLLVAAARNDEVAVRTIMADLSKNLE